MKTESEGVADNGLDLALGAGVAGFDFFCRCGQYVHLVHLRELLAVGCR